MRHLFRITSSYFIVKFILNLSKIVFKIEESKLNGIVPPFYKDYVRVIFLIIILFVNILKFLYAFYSFKGVNFKLWMWKIFSGYKISHLYHQSSIFIVANKFIESNESVNLLASPVSINSRDLDLTASNEVNYETNDDYKKNYVTYYLTD